MTRIPRGARSRSDGDLVSTELRCLCLRIHWYSIVLFPYCFLRVQLQMLHDSGLTAVSHAIIRDLRDNERRGILTSTSEREREGPYETSINSDVRTNKRAQRSSSSRSIVRAHSSHGRALVVIILILTSITTRGASS